MLVLPALRREGGERRMTADEARERVGEIRAGADRIMRALSVPGPDWTEAALAAGRCVDACAELEARCHAEMLRGRSNDGDR